MDDTKFTKSRALNSEGALNCCEKTGLKNALEIRRVMGELVGAMISPPDEDLNDFALVLFPTGPQVDFPTLTEYRVTWTRLTPGTGQVAGGAIILGLGAVLTSILSTTAALETLNTVMEAIDRVLDKQRKKPGCKECLEPLVWRQNKKIVTVNHPKDRTRKP